MGTYRVLDAGPPLDLGGSCSERRTGMDHSYLGPRTMKHYSYHFPRDQIALVKREGRDRQVARECGFVEIWR